LAVRVIGAFFVTSGMVVVAIRISLALKLFHYSRETSTANHLSHFDADYKGKVALFRFRNKPASRGMKSSPGLAIRAIIMALRPSPGLDGGSRALARKWNAAVWLGRLCRGGL
jgi:hypothetical protein